MNSKSTLNVRVNRFWVDGIHSGIICGCENKVEADIFRPSPARCTECDLILTADGALTFVLERRQQRRRGKRGRHK